MNHLGHGDLRDAHRIVFELPSCSWQGGPPNGAGIVTATGVCRRRDTTGGRGLGGDLSRKKQDAPVVIDNRMAAPQDVCTKDSNHRRNLGGLQSGVDMGQVESEQPRVR